MRDRDGARCDYILDGDRAGSYHEAGMTRGSLVWTTDGDSHSLEHGPWKAVIRTSPSTDDGLVTIRFRITLRDTVDAETTPVFLQVPAAAAARRIETLKSELEGDLLRRHGPEEPKGEDTTDRLEMGTPAPSPGVYILKRPRSGQ